MVREILMFIVLLLSGMRAAWFSPNADVAQSPAAPAAVVRPVAAVCPVAATRPVAAVVPVSDHDHHHSWSDHTETRELPLAMGKKLTIDLDAGGSIEITGWDKESVSADISTDGDCEPEFETSSSGVDISDSCDRGDHYNHSMDVRLSVPSKIDLDLQTSGGAITISGVSGKIAGETMGGDLDLSSLEGSLDLTTMGGDIDLRDSKVDGKVHTMGGHVKLADVVGGVEGSSMGGDVEYKNVRKSASDATVREVLITTMGGEINVDDAPAGATVKTMGGDIHVRTAVGHVKAETMGGDVNLDSVNGWIDARTMGGNVVATMVGDPAKGERNVFIDSKGGDVELTVPSELSMDFDVKLAYTRNYHQDVHIVSDFPLQQDETSDWVTDHGTARKYIYGTGKAGDGKNKITIRTINGNITIRKG